MDIPIELFAFWEFKPENEHNRRYLMDYFKEVLTEYSIQNNYKKIHVYSVFKGEQPPKDLDPCICYVQFSGEPFYNDPNLYNVNLIPVPSRTYSDPFAKKGLIVSTYFAGPHIHMNDMWKRLNGPVRQFNAAKHATQKFCSFVVSNWKCEARNLMFAKLCSVKKVESSGRWMNNTGALAPFGEGDAYFQFLNQYRFMLCFENTSQCSYFTEKLVHAYIGGSIPIYWGCPELPDFINSKAIIHLQGPPTEDAMDRLIQTIMEIDGNPAKYKEMFEQPLFYNNQPPYVLTMAYIKDSLRQLSSLSSNLTSFAQ